MIATDAVNEEAHVGLMRLYALAEQRQQALRQYGHLQEVLKRELDAEPEEAAQHLYQEIQAGRFPAERPRIAQLSQELSAAADHNLPAQLTSFVGREKRDGGGHTLAREDTTAHADRCWGLRQDATGN